MREYLRSRLQCKPMQLICLQIWCLLGYLWWLWGYLIWKELVLISQLVYSLVVPLPFMYRGVRILIENLMDKEPLEQQNHSPLVMFAQKFLVHWCRSSFYGNGLKSVREDQIFEGSILSRSLPFQINEIFDETTVKDGFLNHWQRSSQES